LDKACARFDSVGMASDPLDDLIKHYQRQPGALLPLLHAIQDTLGFIPDRAVAPVATALNLSRAEVHGVLTYYHHFRTQAPARHVIQVCRAEACQSMGSSDLYAHICATTGCKPAADPDTQATTSEDGLICIEPVYCLGLCATAPSLQWNDRQHARVTPARFEALSASHQAIRAEVSP
jgi:formate dehydrogenase subunit gamma